MDITYIKFVLIAVLVVLLTIVFIRVRRKKLHSDTHGQQLYVGNLSYHINAHQLKEIFSPYGEVQSVRVIKNTRTGKSKGFAFVTYTDSKSANKALDLHGQEVKGRAMVVRIAKAMPKTEG